MAKKTAADKIAELEKKRQQIQNRIADERAKQKAESRKVDTRRKVIVGGCILAEMESNPTFAAQVKKILGKKVTREHDRAVLADLVEADKSPPQ